ncbi:MAG: SGNH/GDSL hydrolase family protein [Phycicoccus sp.]
MGDSFTEGLCDHDPDGAAGYIGWADRLATHLDSAAEAEHLPFAYANLAVRGRTLADIVGPQLDAALALGPDLVSMVGGGNDLLRPRVDLDGLAGRLEQAVARIRRAGADVLLATPTDTRDAGAFRLLRARHAVHTANLFTIAQRHGCHVLNLWGIAALREWRMWADDRIHLTTEGHRRVTQAALLALGRPVTDAGWHVPLERLAPEPWRERARSDAVWARTYAAPWVRRRVRGTSSGDTVRAKRPELTPLRDPTTGPPQSPPPTP